LFPPRLHPTFVKKISYEQQYGYQNPQNLMLISKKMQKNHAKKVLSEEVTEKWSFWIITECKIFLPITFLGEFFALFSTDSNSALNFAFYDTYIEMKEKKIMLPVLALFANSIAKIKHTTQKNKQRILYCISVLESHFTSTVSPVWDVPFCQKVKIVVP
jgi:hypothetical protein